MHGICLLGFFHGSFPGILNAERCGDDGDLRNAPFDSGLKQNPGQPGIHRYSGHEPALFGQRISSGADDGGSPVFTAFVFSLSLSPVCVVRLTDGAKLRQQVKAIRDAAGIGLVDKRKIRDGSQLQGHHSQDDFGQVGSEDFRARKLGPGQIIFFGIEPDADAVFQAAAAPFSLIRAASADGPHLQGRGPGPGGVLGNPGKARVNHVLDSGNGQGCFGDIGGDDDFPARGWRKTPGPDPLRKAWQTGEER